MARGPRPHSRADGRWTARLALVAGAAAVSVLLVFAGLRSIVLVGVGVAGLALTAAGVWWTLAHSGLVRALALALVAAAPMTVVALYVSAGLLWVVIVSLVLWGLAVSAGRTALAEGTAAAGVPEVPATPALRPFLIMNPRSGGGKVGRFRLAEKARARGAEVLVLDPDRPQDVAELARRAVADGADLLGVAGGDGTQALVAGVAAEHDLPFTVVPAGTRNHFAMDLGLDREDPTTSLDSLTDGVELRADLGSVDGRVFVNNASFGAYAAVVQSSSYRDDKVHTTLETLPDLLVGESSPHLVVRADSVTIDGPQALLVSNNPYRMDDPAGLGRRDRLDSGVLGVLGIRIDNAGQAALLLRGGHAPGLTALTAHEVLIDAGTPTVPAGIDGEALELPTPVHCRIQPGALRVRVPRHRPGVPPAKPPMDWHRVRRMARTMTRTAAGRTPD